MDIHHSGTHLLKLINELLDISRIESGEMKLSEEAFDLAGCAEEIVHMLEQSAAIRGVVLSCEIADGLPFLYTDETRVKQIFINLASNAIKFTPQKGRSRFRLKNHPPAACSKKLPIPASASASRRMTSKRFLSRSDRSPTILPPPMKGPGWDCPLARLLAERHDGALVIASEPGRGGCITVSFPAQRCIETSRPRSRRVV